MIKFTGTLRGKPSLGLGLTEEDSRRLHDGEIIMVDLKELNLPYDLTILLFAGATEQSMKDVLEKAGVLDEAVTLVIGEKVQ